MAYNPGSLGTGPLNFFNMQGSLNMPWNISNIGGNTGTYQPTSGRFNMGNMGSMIGGIGNSMNGVQSSLSGIGQGETSGQRASSTVQGVGNAVSSVGSSIPGGAGQIVSGIGNVISVLPIGKSTATSNSQADVQGITDAFKGAAGGATAGFAIGGPVGAIVGGVAGLAAGAVGKGGEVIETPGFTEDNQYTKSTGLTRAFGGTKRDRRRKRRSQENVMGNRAAVSGTQNLRADYYSNLQSTDTRTFEMGGLMPYDSSLAYVDDGELLDINGTMIEVPDNGNPTDSNLINLPEGSRVLSDTLIMPGTNMTFAEMGKQVIPRKSKGKGRIAEQTNKLNESNAQLAYNDLFDLQQLTKAVEGVQNENETDIPKYATGGPHGNRYGLPRAYASTNNPSRALTEAIRRNAERQAIEDARQAEQASLIVQNGTYSNLMDWSGLARNIWNTTGRAGNAVIDFVGLPIRDVYGAINNSLLKTVNNPDEFQYRRDIARWLADDRFIGNNSAPVSSNDNYVDAITGASPLGRVNNYLPDSAFVGPLTQPVTTATERIQVAPSTRTTQSTPNSTGNRPTTTRTSSVQQRVALSLPNLYFDNLSTPNQLFADNATPQSRIASPIYDRDVAAGENYLANYDANYGTPSTTRSYGNIMDYVGYASTLAPILANMFPGDPEQTNPEYNPYEDAALRTLRNRRYNVNPEIEAINRNRAVANYNASNANTNTGADMAMRLATARNANQATSDVYARANNVNNQYLGEYATALNDFGRQRVQANEIAKDFNAKSRAQNRNIQRQALTQLADLGQQAAKDRNLRKRDEAYLEAYKPLLDAAYDENTYNRLMNLLNNNKKN